MERRKGTAASAECKVLEEPPARVHTDRNRGRNTDKEAQLRGMVRGEVTEGRSRTGLKSNTGLVHTAGDKTPFILGTAAHQPLTL